MKDIAALWLQLSRTEEALELIETAMKSRALKDGANSRHQKKLDEFLKVTEEVKGVEEVTAKFREIMVKANVVKDDDWIINNYIRLTYV